MYHATLNLPHRRFHYSTLQSIKVLRELLRVTCGYHLPYQHTRILNGRKGASCRDEGGRGCHSLRPCQVVLPTSGTADNCARHALVCGRGACAQPQPAFRNHYRQRLYKQSSLLSPVEGSRGWTKQDAGLTDDPVLAARKTDFHVLHAALLKELRKFTQSCHHTM